MPVTATCSPTLEAVYLHPSGPPARMTEVRRLLQPVIRNYGLDVERTPLGLRLDLWQASEHWNEIAVAVGGLVADELTTRAVRNRRAFLPYEAQVRAEVQLVRNSRPEEVADRIDVARGAEQLDAHQVTNVAAMVIPGSPGLCVFDEQGAGKTVTTIFAYDLLVARDEVDRALIFAPKSMVTEWVHDFERFMGDLYSVSTLSGSRQKKLRTLRDGADVLVTNFETAVSMERELSSALRRRDGRTLLVVDESYFVKNLDAGRTKAIRRLREWCGRAFILCGTPAPNSPSDLVQQSNLVDFGAAFRGIDVPDDRDEALATIRGVVHGRTLYTRHLKRDVLPNLPEKQFHRVLVPLAPRQQQLYTNLIEGLSNDLEQVTDEEFEAHRMSFLARRARLLQVCSDPQAVDPSYEEVPAKRQVLDELLRWLINEQGEKVVLWAYYRRSVDALVERYREYGVLRYDGSVTEVEDRRESVRRFQEDDESMLLIANPAAAGAGLTLHRSRYAVYESLSNQAAHYLQSIDRVHRRGQAREVNYFFLVAHRTLEEREYDRLLEKEDRARDLLGDPPDQSISRTELLEELEDARDLIDSRSVATSSAS